MSVCLSDCLFVNLSVCLSVSLSVILVFGLISYFLLFQMNKKMDTKFLPSKNGLKNNFTAKLQQCFVPKFIKKNYRNGSFLVSGFCSCSYLV